MAATGFTPISTYYTTTASAVPTAGNLVNGELALNINTADGKLFYKDSAGVVQTLATKGTAAIGGSTTQVQYNNAGVLAGSANMTFSGTALTLANDASISGLTIGKGGGAVSNNTALGNLTLASNTSGNRNSGIGFYSQIYTTTGANNSSLGVQSLGANTTGSSNVAIGDSALLSNTTASNNTAVGYQAGYSTTTAANNMYLGYQAGYSLTASSGGNTFVGVGSGYTFNTTSNGFNTLVGYQAGYGLTTGLSNTFVGSSTAGFGSGSAVTTGSKNTILGAYTGNQGGLDIRTSSNYIVLSDGDGNPRGIFDGSGNLLVGTTSQVGKITTNPVSGFNPLTNITGAAYTGTGSYGGGFVALDGTQGYVMWTQSSGEDFYIRRATTTTGVTGGVYISNAAGSWSSASDERLKNIIRPIENAIAKLINYRCVIGEYKDNIGSERPFLIAQDVQETFPEAVNVMDKEHGYLGLSYTELTPLLIKAIQEQQVMIETLTTRLNALEGK